MGFSPVRKIMTGIPQTADAFHSWTHREHGKWPSDLVTLAYLTWRAMVNGQDDPQTAFIREYGRGER